MKKILVAGLALSAGIHFAVAPEHYREYLVFGSFFVAIGLVQAFQALGAFHPGKNSLRWIAAVNLGVVAIWAVSRTTGLPFGPGAGIPEQAGVLDVVSVGLEIAVSAVALVLLRGFSAERSRPSFHRWIPIAVVTGLIMFSTAAASAAPHHSHGHSHGSHQDSAAHLHGLNVPGEIDRGPAVRTPAQGQSIGVGRNPVAITACAGSLWVVNRDDATVSRIGGNTTSIRVPLLPSGIACGFGSLWVSSYGMDSVVRIRPSDSFVSKPIRVSPGPSAIAAGPSGIWVATIAEGTVQHIDPIHMSASKPIHVGFGPTALVVSGDGVWVSNSLDHTVVHVVARSKKLTSTVSVPQGNVGVASGFGQTWVVSTSAGSLTGISSSGGAFTVRVSQNSYPGRGPIAVTTAFGRVWVADNHDKTLVSFDPATGVIGRPIFFDSRLGSYGAMQVIPFKGALWVTNFDRNQIVRLEIGKQ